MKDFFATLGIFTIILLIIALGLYLLSRWHARIEKRLRARQAPYPTISHADLEMEAAYAECGIYPLAEHIRHRNKFEGRHHDAA